MDNLAIKISEVVKEKSGVSRLTLTDFRNYAYLRINADLCPIILTGENGSGKTNILEAISFLTPGRGLRGARLADIKRISPALVGAEYRAPAESLNWAVSGIVKKNNEEYVLGTGAQKNQRETEDEIRTFERRIVQINGQKISSQAELGKYLCAIWITPQMDRLFLGGTQPRRSFLDRIVYAFDVEHAKRIANFEHLYKQWYQLLKNGSADNGWLTSLEEEMACLGVAIAAARRELVARLNTFITNEPDDVFPDIMLELDGTIEKMLDKMAAVDVEDFYINNLKKSRRSVVTNDYVDGVNRTDFKVYYKKKHMPAELCSTGEQKSLLISIILAQTKCQILDKGFAPVLLLDEVTTHLDDIKRDALLHKIKDLKLQAWITSTEHQIFDVLKNDAQFFNVKNNQVF
ncbi:MAG: DNA replication/repair protein RecF [Alphaproteobacteria bacterium]|nr:DNA replication/repair protein RecF [Alphaproteobacteria bacterium]